MRILRSSALAAALGLAVSVQAVEVGKKAPDFSGKDSAGKEQKLSAYKGKYVVLEWVNHGCPFVVSQYGKGKMQKLQEKWTKKDVVWLRVNSSAPGKQGHVDAEACEKEAKERKSKASATILDPAGKIGKKYGAKTTPHMFVVDPQGKLAYMGAIDNAPREAGKVSKGADGSPFVNYVDQALTEATAGKAISVPSTVPYGCGVKYKD
jgi:peroxiredoxin